MDLTQKYYHGTDLESARKMIGPPNTINVDKGGGELGQGFYTGNSMHIAASWAWTRSKPRMKAPVIIVFEIEDKKIATLTVHHIKTQAEVDKLHKELHDSNERKIRKFDKDYVIAPFQTIDGALQYKFESKKSENVINQSETIILPCT